MRIFTAALGTETNTFSPLPTGRLNFEETLMHRRDGSLVSSKLFVLPLKTWRRMAEENRDEIIESLSVFAQPAGRTVEALWVELRDQLLADLAAAGPVDLVLLNLHGAMASEECDDCEGDLVERVRAIVGLGVPIGVELDLHCHITDHLMTTASVVILYKEYPHTDVVERAVELFDIARRAALGELRPVMALRDCRMLGVWRTSDAEVRAVVDWMEQAEQRPGVLSVSFCHGFPWADLPDVGAKTLVVADGDAALARDVASELADIVLALRYTYRPSMLSVPEAMAEIRQGDGPIVLADISDNAGGGAASDSTFVLDALLAAGTQDVLFGIIWDPVAVRLCEEAGEGASLPLRIGGKISPASGQPVDLNVRVVKLVHNATVSFGGGRQEIGTAALVEAGGIQIVINTIRTQTFHADAYTQFGLDLAAYRVIVVKSAQHFHAGFAPVAKRILYVVAPGTVSPDFTTIEMGRAGRPLWPQVEDPFAAA